MEAISARAQNGRQTHLPRLCKWWSLLATPAAVQVAVCLATIAAMATMVFWLFSAGPAEAALPSPKVATANPQAKQPPDKKPRLPASFDLRNVDGVTPVKKQQGGTCFAFGAMAAIESNLLVSGKWKALGMKGIPLCSEYHLDWWNGFNRSYNPDHPDPSEDKTGLTVHQGGDYRMSAAYLSRGDGVVLIPEGVAETVWYKTAPAQHDPNYQRLYMRDIEWFTIGNNLEGIERIKERIIKQGGIATCYLSSGRYLSKENIHYQPIEDKGYPNHAVCIVGWDDNKIALEEEGKQAPQPGAWLIKNSWGPIRGDKGYYWISYYDKFCGRDPENGAVSFRNLELMPYTQIYHHDLHGWRATLPDISKAFNAFKAAVPQTIKAVSFYTTMHDDRFTIKIYGKFDGNKLDHVLASQDDSSEFCGFHTLDLQKPVRLKANQPFYVCVELWNGGHAIDRTSKIPVLLDQQQPETGGVVVVSKASRGESYYHDGQKWADLFDYKFANPDWGTFDRTANFCMKALAVGE